MDQDIPGILWAEPEDAECRSCLESFDHATAQGLNLVCPWCGGRIVVGPR